MYLSEVGRYVLSQFSDYYLFLFFGYSNRYLCIFLPHFFSNATCSEARRVLRKSCLHNDALRLNNL